jgi:DNA-binding response OmpR family regulator
MERQKTSPAIREVLLFEDDADDTLFLSQLLADAEKRTPGGLHVALTCVNRLEAGLQYLTAKRFDLILLDLGLPDSQGLDTLKSVHGKAEQVAIIVLTGLDDERLGLEAVHQGAQDYLVKGQTDEPLLRRALSYAIERQRLQRELEAARQRGEMERERVERARMDQQFAAMAGTPDRAIRGQTGEFSPAQIQELVQGYQGIIARYVRAVRKQEVQPSQELRAFAVQLAALHTGARDVVRIHLAVLEQFSGQALLAEENSFSKDARLALIELLGSLLDLYRQGSLGRVPVARREI